MSAATARGSTRRNRLLSRRCGDADGQFDNTYPIKTSQDPFFRLLGTPDGAKKRLVYQDNHGVPKVPMIKEALRWYDTYLGR